MSGVGPDPHDRARKKKKLSVSLTIAAAVRPHKRGFHLPAHGRHEQGLPPQAGHHLSGGALLDGGGLLRRDERSEIGRGGDSGGRARSPAGRAGG